MTKLTPAEREQFRKDANLVAGVRLAILYPQVASRDCDDCQKWHYDEETGEIATRAGKLMPRVAEPPCRHRTGCPKGTPENSRELTTENKRIYTSYLTHKACGTHPESEYERRQMRLIRSVEDQIARQQTTKTHELLQTLINAVRGLKS